MSQSNAEILSSVIAVVFALTVIVVRVRGSRKPVNARKIWIPPVAMSTGFCMFVSKSTHEPWLWALCAFVVGMFFSYPLVATSHMSIQGKDIYLKRSRSFVFILLGLLILRLVLHSYVEQYVSIPQTASLFFILAYGMILPWRVAMYLRYERLFKQLQLKSKAMA